MRLSWYLTFLLGFSSCSSSPLLAQLLGEEFTLSRERGALLYEDYCQHCHLPDGKGSKTIPPLAQSDWMQKNRTGTIQALKFGQKGPIVVNGEKFDGYMPPMGLDNQEIADICNFIFSHWGHRLEVPFSEEEVKKVALSPK
jgi:mono/diheme cytochrome c family protein